MKGELTPVSLQRRSLRGRHSRTNVVNTRKVCRQTDRLSVCQEVLGMEVRAAALFYPQTRRCLGARRGHGGHAPSPVTTR